MSKNNKGLIIIVIIVVILMGTSGKKEGISVKNTKELCETELDLQYGCSTECFFGTDYRINVCEVWYVAAGKWSYYNSQDCDYHSSEQAIVDCLVNDGVDLIEVTPPSFGCSGPSADEMEFACRDGGVDQCINGDWDKIDDCSDFSGFTEPCETSRARSTESRAQEDCTEVQAIDVWCLKKDCSTCVKQTNSCTTTTYFSTKYSTSASCATAGQTACGPGSCSDTDGQNFKTRGSVTYDTGGVLGPATVYDVCLNDGVTLIEQVCTGTTNSEITKDCRDFGSDWSCESIERKGACVKDIVVTYTYECKGANSEIGYTASSGGGLVDVGTCGSGKECGDSLFKNSDTLLSLQGARNLICQLKDCISDNSCAADTCIGKSCTNNCEQIIAGTKDCGTPPPSCTSDSDCSTGKECNSKGRCVSECLPLLQEWDKDEGQCGVTSVVILIGIFLAVMIALKMIPKKN